MPPSGPANGDGNRHNHDNLPTLLLGKGGEDLTSAGTFSAALGLTIPILLAGLGGLYAERSGIVNIGLEGMMLMGAFWGIWGADKTGSWVSGVVIALIAGGLLALVHAFFAIHLRADQIVGGMAVNFLALGNTAYFFVQLYHGENVPVGVSQIPDVTGDDTQSAQALLRGAGYRSAVQTQALGWPS